MPTNFDSSYVGGDVVQPDHSKQHTIPINNLESGTSYWAADTATGTDNYLVTVSPDPGSYTEGYFIHFKPNTDNTGVATININSIGSNIIKKGSRDLQDGDLLAGHVYILVYSGSNFQLAGTLTSVKILNEVPSGTMDGANLDFTLAHTPIPGTLRVFINSLRSTPTTHYTVSGTTLSTTTALESGDRLEVDYEYN